MNIKHSQKTINNNSNAVLVNKSFYQKKIAFHKPIPKIHEKLRSQNSLKLPSKNSIYPKYKKIKTHILKSQQNLLLKNTSTLPIKFDEKNNQNDQFLFSKTPQQLKEAKTRENKPKNLSDKINTKTQAINTIGADNKNTKSKKNNTIPKPKNVNTKNTPAKIQKQDQKITQENSKKPNTKIINKESNLIQYTNSPKKKTTSIIQYRNNKNNPQNNNKDSQLSTIITVLWLVLFVIVLFYLVTKLFKLIKQKNLQKHTRDESNPFNPKKSNQNLQQNTSNISPFPQNNNQKTQNINAKTNTQKNTLDYTIESIKAQNNRLIDRINYQEKYNKNIVEKIKNQNQKITQLYQNKQTLSEKILTLEKKLQDINKNMTDQIISTKFVESIKKKKKFLEFIILHVL